MLELSSSSKLPFNFLAGVTLRLLLSLLTIAISQLSEYSLKWFNYLSAYLIKSLAMNFVLDLSGIKCSFLVGKSVETNDLLTLSIEWDELLNGVSKVDFDWLLNWLIIDSNNSSKVEFDYWLMFYYCLVWELNDYKEVYSYYDCSVRIYLVWFSELLSGFYALFIECISDYSH